MKDKHGHELNRGDECLYVGPVLKLLGATIRVASEQGEQIVGLIVDRNKTAVFDPSSLVRVRVWDADTGTWTER